MLIEPTESESKAELDRFLDALISIRKELSTEQGRFLIKNAPFDLDSAFQLASDPKGRLKLASSSSSSSEGEKLGSPAQILQNAVYPVENLKKNKFWPSVARVDDTYGPFLFSPSFLFLFFCFNLLSVFFLFCGCCYIPR
jgi:glycine dehydrogenase